ncbi:MAG: DUF2203 family protein [Candidatus Latescibacteria bacterium]|nr:DUF2203 family protein [Candidatus Latescibacterota bacterium]NIM21404.1 DUF2203 family protein [Candidatus Latescibacterota bacterium]NIM65585.1 DUF2203 family protein [Candidatus Latescibacterota bacterium]NIO01965.1 DUF2203 family protein [Candidatus Latescibacterota bacterium]NIO28778.1 DUF2203 family protein [Candidatus Latescibacterota bacterium]
MNPKYFTVDEANRLVGFLEVTLERIRRNKQKYLWLKEEISILNLIVECGMTESNPDSILLREKKETFKKVGMSIEKDIAAINETGCVLRDVDKGLVDFYSKQEGIVIFLCWKKGEESVMYWHPTNTGFKGRQPLYRRSST